MERRRLPLGERAIREMLVRWAKGRVYDLFLRITKVSLFYLFSAPSCKGCEGPVLHEIKNCNSIANRRKQASAVWSEDEVSLAINGPQKVGKLRRKFSYR